MAWLDWVVDRCMASLGMVRHTAPWFPHLPAVHFAHGGAASSLAVDDRTRPVWIAVFVVASQSALDDQNMGDCRQ